MRSILLGIVTIAWLAACGSHPAPGSAGGGTIGNHGDTGDVSSKNGSACPATYAELASAGACSAVDATCAYAEGNCFCGSRSYCGGIAPSQETLDSLRAPVWQCTAARTDGCPEQPPSGACSEEGKQCGYGDCCMETDTCSGGTWQRGAPSCPP